MTATRRTRPRANARGHVRQPAARRSRRSPTTRSSRTATPARCRAGRHGRVAVPAALRRAERLRCAARPRRRRLPPRPLRLQRARARAATSPGTNILETTWMTPSGWLVVRDALTIGPWRDSSDPTRRHTRPPTDHDADHVLVRTIECVQGERAGRADLRADVRLRARAGRVGGRSTATRVARRDRRRDDRAPAHRPAARHRGQPRPRAPHAARGRAALLRARPGRADLARPAHRRGGERRCSTAPRTSGAAGSPPAASPTTRWRGHLQRSALVAQGPDLRADRGDGRRARRPRCRRRRAASATGTTATAGCATRRSRCGACTRSGSTGRPTTSCSSSPTSTRNGDGSLQIMYGDRRRARPDRADARPPHRLRRRAPGAHRQRRVQPAAERRLRRGARLGLPAHQAWRPHPAAAVAGARGPGQRRDRGLAASPTRASGRRAASRSTTSPRS